MLNKASICFIIACAAFIVGCVGVIETGVEEGSISPDADGSGGGETTDPCGLTGCGMDAGQKTRIRQMPKQRMRTNRTGTSQTGM